MSKLTKFTRFCCDFLILTLLCFLDFIFSEWVKPFKRGFFCNDESLSYPYRESSVKTFELCCIFAVPILVIIFTELLRTVNTTSESNHKLHKPSYKLGSRLLRCYKYIGSYLYGLALTMLASDLSKKYIGRLRPHFFEVCNPKLSDGTTCLDIENHGKYIEDYICLNQNNTLYNINDSHQSFPSLHSSFTFYIMVFLALYLQAILKSRATKLLKHLLQFIALMFAWYVAITRIADYWHHWSDVLVGITLGCFVAIICGHLIAEFFMKSNTVSDYQKDSNKGPNRKLPPLQVRPTSVSAKSAAAAMAATAGIATATLPAYTFGSLQLHQSPQTIYESYANYGYVP